MKNISWYRTYRRIFDDSELVLVAGEDRSVVIRIENGHYDVERSSSWRWTSAVDGAQSQPVLGLCLAVHPPVQSQLHLGRSVQFGADVESEFAGGARRSVELVALDGVVGAVGVGRRRQDVAASGLRRLDDRQLDLGVAELRRVVVHVQNLDSHLKSQINK